MNAQYVIHHFEENPALVGAIGELVAENPAIFILRLQDGQKVVLNTDTDSAQLVDDYIDEATTAAQESLIDTFVNVPEWDQYHVGYLECVHQRGGYLYAHIYIEACPNGDYWWNIPYNNCKRIAGMVA